MKKIPKTSLNSSRRKRRSRESTEVNSRQTAPSPAQAALVFETQRVAFDEMNLVELPFATLTKEGEALEDEVPLGPSGDESLIPGRNQSLPTALAERAVLALMWLTKKANGFETPAVRFSVRRLVEEFMYPDRFTKNRASGELLKRVERELNRVADTRIHTNRWYDRTLKKRTKMNAAIIDYIQVVEEGGRNKPRLLEMKWGEQIYKSIRAQYTKALDVGTILRIRKPVDLRFYRWLDRQLATKSRQEVQSCQNFARYKLLMTGQKIDRGGRTASSYIVGKLRASLERLDSVGFSVRMTVDESQNDYALIFERIDGEVNETELRDGPAELVWRFRELFHGATRRPGKKTRLPESDREAARDWVDAYGEKQALWMVERCWRLHQKSRRADETLYRFAALAFYEPKAAADWDREIESKARKKASVKADQEAQTQRLERLADAKKRLGKEKLAALRTLVQEEVEAEYEKLKFKPPAAAIAQHIDAELEERLLRGTIA